MTIKEMQDNIVGKFGLEAKETILFFKLCEKLKEDTAFNRNLIKLCHNSLLGIIDRKRIEEAKEEAKKQEEELMKKVVEKMVDEEINNV